MFDITTELSNHNKKYYLLFQRTSWVFPIDLSRNPRYIDVVYNQVTILYLYRPLLEFMEVVIFIDNIFVTITVYTRLLGWIFTVCCIKHVTRTYEG